MSNKVNFNVENIEKLVWCKTKSTYYYDSKIPHHRIVITKTGIKTFQIYMRYNGQPIKRKIGNYPDISPEKARELAKTIISELVLGTDRFTEKQELKNERTYADIWKDYLLYLTDKANQKPKTASKNIRQHLCQYEKYASFHNLKLHEITTEKLINFHRDYSLKKGKKIMANNIIRQIRACFNYANFEPNPAISRRIKFNKSNKRKKYLRTNEMQAFVNAALQDESRDYRDIFLLCLFTAQRIGSIMSMEWKDIKFNHGVWEPITKTSNNENDIMPIGLNERTLEILKRRKKLNVEKNRWVFPATSKSGHCCQPQKAFIRICKRAGLEGFTPHDLRRTAISQLAQQGASDQELLTLLGNKTFDTREVYAQRNVGLVAKQYNTVLDTILSNVKVV